MEGARPAKDCPGLDSTAVCSCARLSVLGSAKGWTPRRAKACRPDMASGRPRLNYGRGLRRRLDPTGVYMARSGRAAVGNPTWLQRRWQVTHTDGPVSWWPGTEPGVACDLSP